MQFCTGDDDEDTNCCFFDQSNPTQRQSYKHSREAYNAASKHRRDQKNIQNPQKQLRLISKNHRKIKSQEKAKLSLSKLTARRGNCSKDGCQQKQNNLQMGSFHSSAPKTNHNHYTKNSPSTINNLPQPIAHNHNICYKVQTNSNFPSNFMIGNTNSFTYQNKVYVHGQCSTQHIVGANFNQFQHKISPHAHYNNFQSYATVKYKLQNSRQHELFGQINQHQMTRQINQHHLKVNHFRNPGLQNFQQKNSQKLQPEFNANQINLTMKTVMPTLETDRIMTRSQQKSFASHINLTNSQHQSQIHPSLHELRPEINFAESRYTQQNSPQLDKTHLKTVQSVYSEDAGLKKEVNESIILVDYFNPSQSVKRQIQQRIYNRYTGNQYNFGL